MDQSRDYREELITLANNSPDGMAIVDLDGEITFCNPAFTEMQLDNVLVKEVADSAISQGRVEHRPLRVTGGREIAVTACPVPGKPDRVAVICRDVTELVNLRREASAKKELSEMYHTELETLRTKYMGHTIVCSSRAMRNIFDLAVRVAKVESNILILGESGVGKDVVARLIHRAGNRAEAPFISINCGAIPENLLESELFGYEPGAFTGAGREGKPGLFELAHTGTLFLNEVAELPPSLQVKLLNVIQERVVTRVGGTKSLEVDFRLIAATNKDLEALVNSGKFRPDLYYRLNVVPITIPPLRQRRDDIPELVVHFLRKFNEKYQLSKSISPEVMDYFMHYNWPGNVRELENLLERLAVITPHDTVKGTDLPGTFLKRARRPGPGDAVSEKELIKELYQRMRSTRKVAAAMGVHQSTVVRKMKKYNLKPG